MLRTYAFTSRWLVPAPVAECWAAVERSVRGGALPWWPAVRIEPRRRPLELGDVVRLDVRSPWGYRLRVALTVTDLEPCERLAAESAGDLSGRGSLHLAAAGEPGSPYTSVTWVWEVTLVRRWMRLTSPVLRPAFAAAHARVMRRGERGLIAALAAGSDVRNADNHDDPGTSTDRPG